MKKIAGDIIVLHMCTKNHNHNDVWLLRCGVRQNFLSLWTIFCPFTKKNQKFWKTEKNSLEISSFYKSVPKNHDHMLYCSVDIARNKFNCYFSFQAFFLPLYLPNSPKNQNLEKWKKPLEISPFYNSVSKIMVICYTVPEILCVADVIFILGHFLPFYPPNCTKNKNF